MHPNGLNDCSDHCLERTTTLDTMPPTGIMKSATMTLVISLNEPRTRVKFIDSKQSSDNFLTSANATCDVIILTSTLVAQ